MSLDIRLEHNSEAEQRVRAWLEELPVRYDLQRWMFTTRITIDEQQTVNRAFLRHGEPQIALRAAFRSPYGLLNVFIHEQLHVHLHHHQAQVDAAVRELRAIYPQVPVGGSEGAMSERSTYEHLLLCTLERDAVRELLGPELSSKLRPLSYHFIYGEVERNGEVLRDILRRHHLTLD